MKCTITNDMARHSVDNIIKDCCNQNTCCEKCGYEDCLEGCQLFEERNTCVGCKFVRGKIA